MGEYNSRLYENYRITLKNSEESKLKNSISHIGKKHGPKTSSSKKAISDNLKKQKLLSKEFIIYNENDEIQFEIHGRFDTFCKENNLPFTALRDSYLNEGARIYLSKNKTRITKIKNSGFWKYKGWYSKYK